MKVPDFMSGFFIGASLGAGTAREGENSQWLFEFSLLGLERSFS
jgi:hypothetical protein